MLPPTGTRDLRRQMSKGRQKCRPDRAKDARRYWKYKGACQSCDDEETRSRDKR